MVRPFPIEPESLREQIQLATHAITRCRKALAISHIDADGITSLSIVVSMLKRLGKEVVWRNIHQLNSETVIEVGCLAGELQPDLVIFSDLGSGQIGLVQEHVQVAPSVECIIILDHHIPDEDSDTRSPLPDGHGIIEVNPCQHGVAGSHDLSGAGVAFLVAYTVSPDNVDLSELAVVGATGDLQDYYGSGFSGINKAIVRLAESEGYVAVRRDLTFFGISTRPLPYLLEYATDPYLPGITGNRAACFAFFDEIGITLKDRDENWRTWADLANEEKKQIIQRLIDVIIRSYDNPRAATGIIGDVMTLVRRPPKTELRTAKEFSTLLNACGRNRKAEVGVRICLGDLEAWREGQVLLQQHRANLASALRRLETGGFIEKPGMYLVMDPETPDTIIGVVIGMAQGSRIIPTDKPVIGVSTKTSGDSPMVKISGRVGRSLVKSGVNLRDAFVSASQSLNRVHDRMVAEGGGHPMAAGAFVLPEYLEEFLDLVSNLIVRMLKLDSEEKAR